MRLAVTGATGFVGSHVIDRALAAGHTITALTRRPQPDRTGITWIAGHLADQAALTRLAQGADAIIHIAGVLNVPTQAEFEAGNIAGTAAMLAAATAAEVHKFVFVSSLAAREPQLSMYGASKAQAEALVEASAARLGDRPPARGLWPRRPRDARFVQNGSARPDAHAPARPSLAHPRRRSRRFASRARRAQPHPNR